MNATPELTGFTKANALTTEQLEQLYAAAQKSPEAFNALLKSLKETNVALQETGKAADVMYGKLIPADKKIGIPKGGRSGKMRLRSDYVQPLIGSPQAQLEMILGRRPDTYARGSAKLAKSASKIGEDMNKQGDLYKQGVGKITAANKTLVSSLGNMPASLLPIKQGIASIPAATKPAVTAANAMAKALNNIPKATKPQVTAKVTGQSQVDQMKRALANIPKNVTTNVRIRQLGNVPTYSRFYRPSQHGHEGIVKRPTLFMAGEGGRRERVSVHPIGSANERGRGGAAVSFEGRIQLVLSDGTALDAYIRRVAGSRQGIAK